MHIFSVGKRGGPIIKIEVDRLSCRFCGTISMICRSSERIGGRIFDGGIFEWVKGPKRRNCMGLLHCLPCSRRS